MKKNILLISTLSLVAFGVGFALSNRKYQKVNFNNKGIEKREDIIKQINSLYKAMGKEGTYTPMEEDSREYLLDLLQTTLSDFSKK